MLKTIICIGLYALPICCSSNQTSSSHQSSSSHTKKSVLDLLDQKELDYDSITFGMCGLNNRNLTSLKGLKNTRAVEHISATGNHITKIEDGIFLGNLNVLNLADNEISSIEPNALPPTLQGLFIANNNMRIIKKNSLSNNLKYLDLQNNLIETIEDEALSKNLRVVYLNGNRLSPHAIEAIRKQLSKNCYLICTDQDYQYRYKIHIMQFANRKTYLLDALRKIGLKNISADTSYTRTIAHTNDLKNGFDQNVSALIKWLALFDSIDAVTIHHWSNDTYKRFATFTIMNGKINKKNS